MLHYLIFFLPVAVTGITIYFKKELDWKEIGIQFFASWFIGAIVIIFATGNMMRDIEILNGEVTGKTRVEDEYVHSYSCNCVTTCSGSGNNQTCTETCQTCYEDRYTVDWDIQCTAGNIHVDSIDWASKSAWDEPDPPVFKSAIKGEFCARPHAYTNYVKAASSSLFNQDTTENLTGYAVPPYPRIFGMYKINRVNGLPGNLNTELNKGLNIYLKKNGFKKQVNIVVLGTTADQMYRHAVERQWKGGKKNDVIVLIGYNKDFEIKWADTITLGSNSGNELMTVKMRDSIMATGKLDTGLLSNAITSTIDKHFDRKSMKDFEYLKDDIHPSGTVVTVSIVLCLLVNLGIFLFFRHQRNSYRRMW